jgi:hypothetical protein
VLVYFCLGLIFRLFSIDVKFKLHDTTCSACVIIFYPGGCNGCLNVENADNAGLSDIIEELEAVYTENDFSSILSRQEGLA